MVDLDLLKKKLEQIKNPEKGGSDGKYIKLAEGDNIVRILPYENETDGCFYVETATHRLVKNGDVSYVSCPRFHDKNSKCPVCEQYFDLWRLADKEKNDKLKKFANTLRAMKRFYVNVLDREDSKVKILSYGIKLHEIFLDTFTDEDYGDITDPETGYDFNVKKAFVGQGGNQWPDFTKSKPKKTSTKLLEEGDVRSILESAHKLEDELKFIDYEDLKAYAEAKLVEASSMISASSANTESNDDEDSSNGADYLGHLNNM